MRHFRTLALLLLLLVVSPSAAGERCVDGLKRHPAPSRLIAIGDIHGDFGALQAALRLGGAIDDKDRWIGGALWVVHTGDYLDRGDGELKIMRLLDRLEGQAAKAGGRFIVLNANHEIINVDWIFGFVTDVGFTDFREVDALDLENPKVAALPKKKRHRAAAFMPGGPLARRLAERPLYAIVGDTVFVHGGISPAHVVYGLERITEEMRAWMRGETEGCPAALKGHKAPVWMRDYSRTNGPADCEQLAKVLNLLGVRRMVVGHTVQEHVNSACGGRVWRIDTGMSAHYGGPVEVLEITSDAVKALR
jgi:hypothetical protein